MIDQYTYDLLKRLHEFPFGKDGEELEYNSFQVKYHAIYGDMNQIGNIYSKLESLGYLEIPQNEMKVQILFTKKSFDAVRKYENIIVQNNRKSQIEDENLKLQNEQLRYQNDIKDLNSENLSLQNKQFKNKLSYSIIGVVTGFVLANWKDILIMLQIIDK